MNEEVTGLRRTFYRSHAIIWKAAGKEDDPGPLPCLRDRAPKSSGSASSLQREGERRERGRRAGGLSEGNG
jgi:hypothetical protein